MSIHSFHPADASDQFGEGIDLADATGRILRSLIVEQPKQYQGVLVILICLMFQLIRQAACSGGIREL